MKHPEAQIQMAFIKWVALQHPKFYDFFIRVDFGFSGMLNPIRGKIFKKLGAKPGVADVLFMWHKKDFGGLWLEFKSSNGKQSPVQKRFEELCHEAKYDYHLVKSVDEAIIAFNRYIELP